MIKLELENLIITTMEPHHVASMSLWDRDDNPVTAEYDFEDYSVEALERWYANHRQQWNNRLVAIIEDGQTIGYFLLEDMQFANGTAKITLVLDPKRRGEGWGRKVTTLFLRHYFFDLHMRRALFFIHPDNKVAAHLIEDISGQKRGDKWYTVACNVPSNAANNPRWRRFFGHWQKKGNRYLLLRSFFVENLREKGAK